MVKWVIRIIPRQISSQSTGTWKAKFSAGDRIPPKNISTRLRKKPPIVLWQNHLWIGNWSGFFSVWNSATKDPLKLSWKICPHLNSLSEQRIIPAYFWMGGLACEQKWLRVFLSLSLYVYIYIHVLIPIPTHWTTFGVSQVPGLLPNELCKSFMTSFSRSIYENWKDFAP